MYKSFYGKTSKAAMQDAVAWQMLNYAKNKEEITFNQAAKLFVANRLNVLSPSTKRGYLSIMKTLSREYEGFNNMRCVAITNEKLQELINDLVKTRSVKTTWNYFVFIQTVLKAQGMKEYDVVLPRVRKPRLNIPENEDIKILFNAIQGTELEIPVLLAALCPMRRGEIAAANISDLFDDNILHVSKSMVLNESKEWVIKAPKTAAGDRYILLPDKLADMIRKQGYITKLNPGNITDHFRRFLVSNNLKRIRFHDLRHFAVSFCLAANIPPEYIQARGGWSSDYTMKNYFHTLEEQNRVASTRVNDAFNALF